MPQRRRAKGPTNCRKAIPLLVQMYTMQCVAGKRVCQPSQVGFYLYGRGKNQGYFSVIEPRILSFQLSISGSTDAPEVTIEDGKHYFLPQPQAKSRPGVEDTRRATLLFHSQTRVDWLPTLIRPLVNDWKSLNWSANCGAIAYHASSCLPHRDNGGLGQAAADSW